MIRLLLLLSVVLCLSAMFGWWHYAADFIPWQKAHWLWLRDWLVQKQTLPPELMISLYITGVSMIVSVALILIFGARAGSKTLHGGHGQNTLHGSAKWATYKDVKKTGLVSKNGVVVGGFVKKTGFSRGIKVLRHNGPEHIMSYAPTRSGKGVSLVLPTLLSWLHSVLVLDIKGENYALTSGFRASMGQRVLRFDPASETGSAKFNPLAEIRRGTGHEIADAQNIAMMIVDPDGKGLKDFWLKDGFEWMATVILHVIYKIQIEENRDANLRDVSLFMSGAAGEPGEEEGFDNLLKDMMVYGHGSPHVSEEVRRCSSAMLIRAPNERSGVHSSATVVLALYADPIVAANISASDFCINDLMNGDNPTSLYLVIPPSDIDRLRPLTRIIMNLIMRRLTSKIEFRDGRSVQGYKHKLLLMLDEFTSIGKLEIFEQSLAFMAGYGLKAFIIVQDLTQLQKEYGREEAITSNCHIKIAFAPNKIETAKVLETMSGEMTVVQEKRSVSGSPGQTKSVSISLSETKRPLIMASETMKLPGLQKNAKDEVIAAGDMLIFPAGSSPIYGRQTLYFMNKELLARAKIPPPEPAIIYEDTRPAMMSYREALDQQEVS